MGNKDTSFQKTSPIRFGEKLQNFSKPVIMGILNLTPDSFFDGGNYSNPEQWLSQTQKMLDEGAEIIDLGAMSTRPGADLISKEDELARLIPPLKLLKHHFPDVLFSIDTFRSEVARRCVDEGAQMINDVSGGNFDPKMFATIAGLNVLYVLMHMHGMPKGMQKTPISTNIIPRVRSFFEDKVQELHWLGFEDIILDPGFGFGKTLECNYQLLKHMEEIRIGRLPILAGVSRKSMINKVLHTQPSQALNGTTVLHTLALLHGANILRVHDVKEAREAIEILEYYQKEADCKG